MADLSYIQATQEVKIVGQDSTGAQVNQVGADASSNMLVNVNAPIAAGTNTIGAVNQGNAGSNAQAWWVRVGDATNGPAAVGTADPSASALGLAVRNMPRRSSTGTLTNVASSASSVVLLAANTSRLKAMIQNDSNKTLFVKFGTTASATSYTKLMAPGEYYEVPDSYTGELDGIWSAVNGNARVTEVA